jgi:nitrogen regulatory protein PII
MQNKSGQGHKLIALILRDDGRDKRLLRLLRNEKRIIHASSVSCRGIAMLADARTPFHQLPEPELVRKVEVIVPADKAEEMFEFIYEKANIGQPKGGAIWQAELGDCSPYILPQGVPNERN